MTKQTTVLFLICAFLLSSCGNSTTSSSNSNVTTNQFQQSKEEGKEPNTEVSKPNNIPSTEPIPAEKDPETPKTETDQAAPIELKYHMNKNYDIIPNDEETPKKVVLLTFDDGPKEASMINSMIDTLDNHHAKAIFFVNGYRVKENPDLLKLIHDREQIIGNHSWDHIVLKKKTETEVKKQIEDVQKAVKDITGTAPVFFRPPHGGGGDVGKKVAKDNGLLYMTWSNGSLDWEMKASDANKTTALIKNVTDQLHSGSNILMHELPWTVEALEALLVELEGRGYSFVDPRSIELEMR
ncbi:polysaccharide deacetylase family protein [Paenibacillus macquariensis]|uniref:Peptidoglycan/xylan/chitin deacetylase, PgdA/CDA1 family n=1 Tax=Paenibacillus macquariensis TaxID=948756 RepID=A0ABY1JJT7_9BACL|nr:polysaccharide deacetylase family protein [Paenibacillus macquariensis]MEC0089794.1 polysaccharide deacetylase family protein [Paenibacillus macquariensis]OAB30737.1 xylanase deacetylase [Paenibacillus macquariensis subsp. macquariensis]SIQ31325.1 Peptidoglycan/xylan/chitin deacetylase, PgdA/CDA1 family [Paenibacillus macquariensis]